MPPIRGSRSPLALLPEALPHLLQPCTVSYRLTDGTAHFSEVCAMTGRRESSTCWLRSSSCNSVMVSRYKAMRKIGVLAEDLAKSIKESKPEVAMEKGQALIKELATVSGMPAAQAATLQDHLALKAVDIKLSGFEKGLMEVKVVQEVTNQNNRLLVGVLLGGVLAVPSYIGKVAADVELINERSKETKKEVKEMKDKSCSNCGMALYAVAPASPEQDDPALKTMEEEAGWWAWILSYFARLFESD